MLPNQDILFIQYTIQLAINDIQFGYQGWPFGALIVKDSYIFGIGQNQVVATCDPSAHAEVLAIRDACKRLRTYQLPGFTLYSSAEPCPMCLATAYWANIKRIVYCTPTKVVAEYGIRDQFIYQQVCLSPEKRTIPTEKIDNPSSLVPFQLWLQKTKPNKAR
ncbi:nucleoside deaminase [Bacillus carboniphilus]|uniref:Nucleoside deaminase n=1 Tax=Bacillus carboniphilus TaxID=86663 RepID=A0ABY9JXX6_9BACI|nr:nucleoside deaminase [Bacillus carboniphilus]WLR42496.1 nucleoside deaminase [Bacillus carboniphilus]